MSSRKLSDNDKSEIIDLYRQPGETTVTLASRFGVSNSTISRILKSNFSEEDYARILQEKRDARFLGNSQLAAPAQHEEQLPEVLPIATATETPPTVVKLRRRSQVVPDELPQADESPPVEPKEPVGTQLELLDASFFQGSTEKQASFESEIDTTPPANDINQMLGIDLLAEDYSDLDDEDDELEELSEEDDEDEDEDGDNEDGDDEDEDLSLGGNRWNPKIAEVRVLPLSEAALPKICYIVVDRSAELIVRPLREFGDLGQIPSSEVLQKTLPVFDNHRVARRFSNRTQRVIKVPDGRMLQKTSPYLYAKGITRLLVDGQVYSI